MNTNQWANAKLCDIGNLILGGFLFLSPLIFTYPMGVQFWNAVVPAVIIAALSILALLAFTVWEEWINLVVGVWLIVSPWVLEFRETTAMQVSITVGIIVAALAA